MISKLVLPLAMAAAGLSLAGSVFADTYTESGDAGDLPTTAQIASGPANTALTLIDGALELSNGLSGSDMYEILITDPTAFSASTTAFVPGANDFDSQLAIFNAAGVGVIANDDAATGGSQSAIPAGSLTSAVGAYYLLISGSGRYAIDSTNALIFPNYTDGTTDPTSTVAASSALPIAGYTGNSNEAGSYEIALTGAEFVPTGVPEPGTFAYTLAGLAALVLVLKTRRSARAAAVLAFTTLAAAGLHAAPPQNLGAGLLELDTDYRAARNGGAKTLAHDQFMSVVSNYPLARTDALDRVQVEVALDGTVPMKDAVAAFEALGCEITARIPWFHQGLLSMWMPMDKAGKIGRTAGVDSVRLSLKPRHRAGEVPGAGAKVLKANVVNTSGYLGAGITVGALSDSYNELSSSYPVHAAQDVASGDLPGTGNPDGYTTPVNLIKDQSGGEDEGRAMLQIVHDVAPAAHLAFYTADVSEADFAAGIGSLQAAGCKVICDDVGYYDEPMFSDGVVAQAVDRVSGLGTTYFSSAGNDGDSGYSATFNGVTNDTTAQGLLLSQGGITYSGITASESAVLSKFHSFGTDTGGNPILVQKVYVPTTNGASYGGTLIFQWDDPFSSTVSGVKQITTDFDILVFSVSNGTATYLPGRSGHAANFSTNTPYEIPGSQLTAGTQYEFVIALTNRTANAGGPTRDQATHIRWAVETDAAQVVADFVTPNSPNTYGHPCAATCAGTAAYVYSDQFSAAAATYTPIVEAYSSNGPVTIYFDSAGNRLTTPITRKQPLLSTVDGVSTTFFPPETGTLPYSASNPSPDDSDGDYYPNFFGTSAAAPHGAGCAALLLNAAAVNSITLAPADVRSLLSSTTQGQSDQDPTVANATAGATKFSARDRSTYSDPQAYTITYNGAAGTSLTKFVFDLSPLPGNFYPATYAVTTGASASGTGGTAPSISASTVTAADGVSAGTTTLTLTLANFTAGSSLSFGVAQTITVTAGNYYLHGDQLAGAVVKATDSTSATATGTLANTFSKKWNVKTGYGLVDVNAAVNKLLGH